MAAAKRKFKMPDYPTYDPAVEGLGGFAQWTAAAERMASGFELPPEMEAPRIGADAPKAKPKRGGPGRVRIDPDLALIGLQQVPADAAGFKAAFRKAAMAAHPDRGGSLELMQKLNAAWDRIKRRYGR